MSIKHLCADAREFIEKRYEEYGSLLQQTESHLGRIRRFGPLSDVHEFSNFKAQCEALRGGCRQLLQYIDLVKGAHDEPGFINCDFTTILFKKKLSGHLILYKNALYDVSGPYDKEEAKLLVADNVKRKKQKVEYLAARKDIPDSELDYGRMPIPESVRNEVWRRDKGRCVTCASVRNLEFDHMIPVSKGGANTARNIQLLCEECNRRKSDHIG